MNPVGLPQPIIQAKVPSAPVGLPTVRSADLPASLPDPVVSDVQINVQAQAAEQRRFETVQRLAQDIANVFIVGDKRFTIFKDMSGQYVTRFTSLRDGQVTYIPEPELFRMQSSAQNSAPALDIKI
jgi:hypothetical protein